MNIIHTHSLGVISLDLRFMKPHAFALIPVVVENWLCFVGLLTTLVRQVWCE